MAVRLETIKSIPIRSPHCQEEACFQWHMSIPPTCAQHAIFSQGECTSCTNAPNCRLISRILKTNTIWQTLKILSLVNDTGPESSNTSPMFVQKSIALDLELIKEYDMLLMTLNSIWHITTKNISHCYYICSKLSQVTGKSWLWPFCTNSMISIVLNL